MLLYFYESVVYKKKNLLQDLNFIANATNHNYNSRKTLKDIVTIFSKLFGPSFMKSFLTSL